MVDTFTDPPSSFSSSIDQKNLNFSEVGDSHPNACGNGMHPNRSEHIQKLTKTYDKSTEIQNVCENFKEIAKRDICRGLLLPCESTNSVGNLIKFVRNMSKWYKCVNLNPVGCMDMQPAESNRWQRTGCCPLLESAGCIPMQPVGFRLTDFHYLDLLIRLLRVIKLPWLSCCGKA